MQQARMLSRLAVCTRSGLASHSRRGFSSRVGFVGLGNMGGPMARNLLKAGKQVTVFDANAASVADLESAGARSATSLAQFAQDQDVVVTMLPNAQIVRDVFQDLLPSAKPQTLFIDSSTIDPATTRQLADDCAARNCLMVDAPVSGGVVGAQNATLTFMVGGSQTAFDRARAVLQAMGKNVAHCGDNGTGQVAKLCNNLILAISMLGVSEGMNLGVKLGADPKVLASIINTSSGRCWSSDSYNPCPGVMEGVPSARNFDGGFAVDLMLKDLGLARSAAADSDAVLPLGDRAHDLYSQISQAGFARKDFGVAFQLLNELSRTQVTGDQVFSSSGTSSTEK